MKPSEQLTNEQRKRVREIAIVSARYHRVSQAAVYKAVVKALSELVPEMAKDAEQARWYRWLEKMWPNEIARLVHSHHQEGPTSSELGAAIAAAIAQEPKR